MTKLLLIIVLFFSFTCYSFSQNVTLGVETGAGSTNVLLSTSTTVNRYSRTISIYTAAEITAAGGVAGSVSSLWWKKNGTGEYLFGDATLKVYFKYISATQWAAVPSWDTEIIGATQVFSSTTYSIPSGTGFKQVAFDTPFAWDGSSNIAVFVDWYRPGTLTSDITWSRSTTTNTNATRVGSTASGIATLLLNSNRPLLQLQIGPPLPVKLSAFSAALKNEDAHLSWQTLTEQNTSRFEIEVSDDGVTFTKSGSVAAAGNSVAIQSYSFVHLNAVSATARQHYLFYRLKIIDTDGRFSYSKIVKIALQKSNELSVSAYPNPVKDVFTVSVAQQGTNRFSYSVLSMYGRQIAQQTGVLTGSTVWTIDALQQQPAGTYILQVLMGNEHKQIKINKQ